MDALQKIISMPWNCFLLADSVRLCIERLLVPHEIIRAITAGESERIPALSEILRGPDLVTGNFDYEVLLKQRGSIDR